MAEYIVREELYQLICKMPSVGGCASLDKDDVENAILEAPTADVVEVKHGEWIWTENGEADYEQFWVCSVCKEKSYIKTKFCSDCGAKMDGGNAE